MFESSAFFLSRVGRSAESRCRTFLLFAAAALAAATCGAAPVAKRHYEIPAGDAAQTLRLFVQQSGVEIVYVVTKVRSVKTNAVQGDLAARDAIHHMLSGTVLIFFEDPKSGAITVSRNPLSEMVNSSPKIGSKLQDSPTPAK